MVADPRGFAYGDGPESVTGDPTASRERLEARIESAFAEQLAAVADAASTVADEWDGTRTRDRSAVVEPLERRLRDDGTAEALLAVTELVADSLDRPLPADPVAQPPYFVVTGEGPMVRVSFDEPPVRVVVLLRAFAVESGDTAAVYRRIDGVSVEVSFEDAA